MARGPEVMKFLAWCLTAWWATALVLLVLGLSHPSITFHWTTLAYLGMTVLFSTVAFLSLAFDKRQARTGGRRISEGVLHGLEFLGGWPGSLIAQQMFHHKTRKLSFQAVYWGIVIAHLAFVGWVSYLWWTTPVGGTESAPVA